MFEFRTFKIDHLQRMTECLTFKIAPISLLLKQHYYNQDIQNPLEKILTEQLHQS